MDPFLGPLDIQKRSGDEPITADGRQVSTLREFWKWAYSDPAGNTVRGVLAEYLVATALGAEVEARREWDAVDIRTPQGWTVEVKLSAYLQSWAQDKPSKVDFGIAPSAAWDARTNTRSDDVRRHADVYVFCLLHHRDKRTLDPLDLAQWTFYVLPTRALNERHPAQKKIGLFSLHRLSPARTDYAGLAEAAATAAEAQAQGRFIDPTTR